MHNIFETNVLLLLALQVLISIETTTTDMVINMLDNSKKHYCDTETEGKRNMEDYKVVENKLL